MFMMSATTIATLKYIKPSELKTMILAEPRSAPLSATNTEQSSEEPPKKSSVEIDPPPTKSLGIIDVRDADYVDGHLPFHMHVPSTSLNYAMPGLLETLKDTKTVVFHCALSQQRGPAAALRYLRERERRGITTEQDVRVLEGGFVGWQELFGKDERLTVGWEGGDVWSYERGDSIEKALVVD